jgi:hypothetical protein
MSEDHAHAAGQGGTVTVLAPQSQDEVHRQSAAAELARFLVRGSELLARCEALAKVNRGANRLGAIAAAARLMNANAQVARALAHVALVESRRRLIVETIQPPKAENAELNSRFFSTGDDAERAELKREVDRIVAAEAAEQERLAGLAIGSCI